MSPYARLRGTIQRPRKLILDEFGRELDEEGTAGYYTVRCLVQIGQVHRYDGFMHAQLGLSRTELLRNFFGIFSFFDFQIGHLRESRNLHPLSKLDFSRQCRSDEAGRDGHLGGERQSGAGETIQSNGRQEAGREE